MAPKAANIAVATRGTKRTAPQATKSAPPAKVPNFAKVPKKCSMLGAVQEVIEMAEGLPDKCKLMLLATFPIAMRLPAEERHAVHVLVINQVADIIEQTSTRMQQEIDVETAATTSADATKADLQSKLGLAQSRLAAAIQRCQENRDALTEASKLSSVNEAAVISAKTVQREGDAFMEVAKAEKEAYEVAFETNYKPLSSTDLDASVIMAHFNVLQPLIAKLKLDDSLVTTIPGTLMKSRTARGSFEQMVITELEQSLLKHIENLCETVNAAVPAAAERATAVERAEQDWDSATKQKEVAAIAVTEAEDCAKTVNVELESANEAVQVFVPEYANITAVRDQKIEALVGFRDWNVQCFNVLKDKAAKDAAQLAAVVKDVDIVMEVAPSVVAEVASKVVEEVQGQVHAEVGGA